MYTQSEETKRRIRAVGGLTIEDKIRGAQPINAPVEEPEPAQEEPKDANAEPPEPPPWWMANLRVAAYIAIFATALAVYYNTHYNLPPGTSPAFRPKNLKTCRSDYIFGFPVNAVEFKVRQLATHSWEQGTAAEALLEFRNPDLTVFAPTPFPNDKIPYPPIVGVPIKGLEFAQPLILNDGDTLVHDEWGVSDPASLGVAAVVLGQRKTYIMEAATRQKDFLLKKAKRYENGAISHRIASAELWADAIHMFPPFLAYYAVATDDLELMRETVRQIGLYRDELMIKGGVQAGLWKHIVSPTNTSDDGAWSTGVGWAAYGMARVRATISGWRPSNEEMGKEIAQLDHWIWEIFDGAIRTDDDETGLLRNYLGDDSWYGETSGTALLAATVYRMAVLNPQKFANVDYLQWAYEKKQAVSQRVDADGIAKPAQQPLDHKLREPLMKGSPEGESFVLMMGSAARDCKCAGVCS